jgi:hypothetical protein
MTTIEADLSEKLGIPRIQLRKFRRDMDPGRDWGKEHGKIVYTLEGIRKLEELLGLRQTPEGFYFKDKEYKKVQVVRNWPLNKRVLTCRDEEGVELMVSVRDNSNFRPLLTTGDPMMLTVRRNGDGWTLEGRAPRYAGRW